MIDLGFTMQQDPVNGRYHVLIDDVPVSGYATVREGQLWEALMEAYRLLKPPETRAAPGVTPEPSAPEKLPEEEEPAEPEEKEKHKTAHRGRGHHR